MKRFLSLSLLALSMTAVAQTTPADSLAEVKVNETYLHELAPRYTRDYVRLGSFTQHWFLGVQGGYSAFVGSPVGCGDFFDRSTPMLNAYIGKWFTPSIALRLAYQGLKFKDSNLQSNNYQLYHADLMYNVANWFRSPTESLPRWDLSPYIGLGLAHGKDFVTVDGASRNYQFALTYGLQVRYRISRHFHLTGELGGFSTFRDFDTYGDHGKLSDNMLSASIGVAVPLGNPHWRRAVDATPYRNQSNYLLSYVDKLNSNNQALRNRHTIDQKTLDELKKILELEGLLGKYGYLFDDNGNSKNNYRGLLSLRSRLNSSGIADTHDVPDKLAGSPNILNIPIYFFFKLGKAELTDNSQLINLDELAKVAIEHNLKIKIMGAADSATGSTTINNDLSQKRTRFIANELKNRGVDTGNMKGVSLGGIKEFNNAKDNRYSKVAIYLELDADRL